MALTSMAYMPTIGIALAGTTLVGQSIGAGNRDWANRLGNVVIVHVRGAHGHASPCCSSWSGRGCCRCSSAAAAPDAASVVALALVLLWPAAAYQIFDGLYCGASFCLRGAGDTRVPAATALVLSWFLFVPLAHTLIFAPGQGLDRRPAAIRLGAQGRLDRADGVRASC